MRACVRAHVRCENTKVTKRNDKNQNNKSGKSRSRTQPPKISSLFISFLLYATPPFLSLSLIFFFLFGFSLVKSLQRGPRWGG